MSVAISTAARADRGTLSRVQTLVAQAALGPLAMRAAGIVAGLGFQVLLARALGAEGFGVFALALCLQAAAVVIGRAGLDTVTMQTGGPAWHGGRPEYMHSIYRAAMRRAGLCSMLVALVLWWFSAPLAYKVFDEAALGTILPWMALSVVPASLLWVHAGILKTIDQPALAYLVESALLPVLMCLALTLGAPGILLDAEQLAIAYLAASCAVLVVAARLVRARLSRVSQEPCDVLPDWSGQCLPVVMIDSMNFLLAWSPFAILAAASNSMETGLFNAASRMTLQIGTVLVVMGNVFAARFAACHAQNKAAEFESLARRVTRAMLLVSALPLAVLLFLPGLLLSLFGEEFRAAEDVVRILATAQLLNALTGPAGYLLVASGQARLLRSTLLCTLLVTIPACWILSSTHGAAGAALAAGGGLIMQNLIASFLVWSRLGIQHLPFCPARHAGHSCIPPVHTSMESRS